MRVPVLLILALALPSSALADVERCVDEACAQTRSEDFGERGCETGRTASHVRTVTVSVPTAAQNVLVTVESSCSSSSNGHQRHFAVSADGVVFEWTSEERLDPPSYACSMRVNGEPPADEEAPDQCPAGPPPLLPRLP